MSIPVYNAGHLSECDLQALKEGTLHEAKILALSEHMSDCMMCAGRFAACFGEDELLEVPAGFRENIVNRLRPEKEDKRQMLFYSVRVAVAACLTLIFIFSGVLNFIQGMESKIEGYGVEGLYLADSVNSGFQNFSKKVLDLEVFINENEKK